MKRDRFDKGILLIAVIVIVLIGAGLVVASYVRTDIISDLAASGGQLSIVFLFELPDERLVTEVLYFDTSTNRAALFDIPANTGVVVASLNRVDGIDTIYWNDGIEPYRAAISELLGAAVDYHVVLTPDGLETISDLLEGIPIFVADVPETIRIPTGDVVLDGAKMRTYTAYAPEGERDRERIARAQKVVAGIVRRMGDKSDLVADPVGSVILSDALEMNIDRRAFISLASLFRGLEVDRIITRQVEGTTRQVETGDESEALLFPHQEGRWLAESVRQVVANLQSQESLRDENIVIRLEILNGTENAGLARRTAELYRSYGFDVVTVGNADRDDIHETVVLDRVGNEIFATRTADIIRSSLIDLRPRAEAGVDVTVVLGEDFDGRYVR